MPIATIRWKFRSSNSDEILSFNRIPFPIVNFSFKNEGSYICEATNGIGKAIERIIRVQGIAKNPPAIHKAEMRAIVVSVGVDLKLNCHCEMCEPLTELSWMHEKNGVFDGKFGNLTTNIGSNQVDFSLNLNNVTVNDTGIYTCFMKNDFGDDKFAMDVIVKQTPNIVMANTDQSGTKRASSEMLHSDCVLNERTDANIRQTIDADVSIEKSIEIYDCHVLNHAGIVVKQFFIYLIGKVYAKDLLVKPNFH